MSAPSIPLSDRRASRRARHRLFAACAAFGLAALLAATPPARAVGSLVDVQVVDRSTGETLPMYWHHGRWWVPGKPGSRYAITLANRSGGRALTVLSVDGVNVVSGESAAHDQVGYVIANGQYAQITGWRKDMSRVAAFEFTALADSYAARTGRPDNVGVIGVAVFRERPRPPSPSVPPLAKAERQEPARDAALRRCRRLERGRRPATQRQCARAAARHRSRPQRALADVVYRLRARPTDAERVDRNPLRQPRQPDCNGRDSTGAADARSVPGTGRIRS